MKKKLIAAVTSLVMVATLAPATAFATVDAGSVSAKSTVQTREAALSKNAQAFITAMDDLGNVTTVTGYTASMDDAINAACAAYNALNANQQKEEGVPEKIEQLKSLVASQWEQRIAKLNTTADAIAEKVDAEDADVPVALKALIDKFYTTNNAMYNALGDGTTTNKLGLFKEKQDADKAKTSINTIINDAIAVNPVVEAIAALEKVTVDNYKTVVTKDARTAYNRLSLERQQKVGNYNDLVAAEAAIADYTKQVADVKDLIAKIPTKAPTAETIADYTAAYDAAKAAYDKLDPALKEDVENSNALTTAEGNIDAYQDTVKGAEKEAAATKLIQDLPNSTAVKANDALQIALAQAAYNDLTGGGKGLKANIKAEVVGKLEDTVKALNKVIFPDTTKPTTADATAVNEAVQPVKDLIAAIPSVDKITKADENNIKTARAAYDAMTGAFQGEYSKLNTTFSGKLSTEKTTLSTAEKQLTAVKGEDTTAITSFVNAVNSIQALANIKDTNTVNATYKTKTIAAREAYNALSPEQKKIIEETEAVSETDAKYASNAKVAYEKLLVAEANVASFDKIYEVAALIKAVPTAKTLDVTNATEVQKVKAAQTAFEALTKGVQGQITGTNDRGSEYLTAGQVKNYRDAVAKVAKAEATDAAQLVVSAIKNLPTLPKEFKSKADIDAAKAPIDQIEAAYANLTAEQKAAVTNYSAFEQYENAYTKLLNDYVKTLYADAAKIDTSKDLSKADAAKIAELKAYIDDKYIKTSAIVGFNQTTYDKLVEALTTFQKTMGTLENATISAIADQTYTGEAITPEITVTDKAGDVIAATEYIVVYSNNKDAGTAGVTVAAKSGSAYTGTQTAEFKINPADASKATVTIANTTYNGKAKKPVVKVVVNGKTLAEGTDFDAVYTNNTKVGKAKVAITAKGNYTGTASKSFVVKPGKAQVTSLKAASKKVTVKVKAIPGATTYKIAYKQKGSNYKYKTVKTTGTTKTIKGLKSGKVYKVKVLAFTKVGSKSYYTGYSTIKTVKVK